MNWLHAHLGYSVAFSFSGMIGAALWLLALFYTAKHHWRQRAPWGNKQSALFFVLLFLSPLAVFITLPHAHRVTLPIATAQSVLLIAPLSALGWVLAAGFLGIPAAMLIAFATGLVLGQGQTHLPAEALSEATLALAFAWALWQPYRSPLYRLLRQPVGAAVLAVMVYPFVAALNLTLVSSHSLAEQIDIVLTATPGLVFYKLAPLLVGAVVAQVLSLWHPLPWGYSGTLQPSPLERSLTHRFSVILASVTLGLAVSILAGNWILAEHSARGLVVQRLSSTLKVASQTTPFFTESGDKIIQDIAKSDTLARLAPGALPVYLQKAQDTSFFFDEILLVDHKGRVIASVPSRAHLLESEFAILDFLKNTGAPAYHHTAFSAVEQKTYVSFGSKVRVPEKKDQDWYLIGRTTLNTNPYAEPITKGLKDLQSDQSGAVILDEKQHILFSTSPTLGWVVEAIVSPTAAENMSSFADTSTRTFAVQNPNGERYLADIVQAQGTTWRVIAISPTSKLQAIALQTALPLTVMVLVVAFIGILAARSLLNIVTGSLRRLTAAAEDIARGQLNVTVDINAVDEVGQLGRAFENMRQRLRDRMDELNRLLHTSQRVAATFKVEEAADAVLKAAVVKGATVARIVLSDDALPDEFGGQYPTTFSRGSNAEHYAALDQQILSLARHHGLLRLTTPRRTSTLTIPPSVPMPQSLIVVALQYKQRFLGALYIIYTQPHLFSDEETRYYRALGLQMAMAANAARLFFTAEVRHQRLLAVLNASPDPILVTDQHGNLILANTAAMEQLPIAPTMNRPVEESITHRGILALLQSSKTPPFSEEITIQNSVYFATVASVATESQEVGRVCILRDITYYKELDALKSEFVATVSHDLRAPLTLMNGYLTMLDMVGELNDRQQRYIEHIQESIKNMTDLVNNLLDLGRIEAGVGLQLQLVSLLDVIDNVLKKWRPLAQQKDIALQTEIAPDTPLVVEADPFLLERVLHNLIDNALKYTPNGGAVTIMARPVGEDRVLLGVKDTGVGISSIDQPRLFEKFFRIVRRGGPATKGSGLGLAIVKSIVNRHHGRVWVESQLGKGSAFFVELPLRHPSSDTLAEEIMLSTGSG